MGLMDFFRPPWKHSNKDVRLSAIKSINDQDILFKIAKHDKEKDVRAAAVKKIQDQKFLAQILDIEKEETVQRAAITNLLGQSVLLNIFKKSNESDFRRLILTEVTNPKEFEFLFKEISSPYERKEVIEHIKNQDILNYIALNSDRYEFRLIAYKKLNILDTPKAWADIAKNAKDEIVRLLVIEKLTDQKIIFEIVKSDDKTPNRLAALAKLTDQNYIYHVAMYDKEIDVGVAAIQRLTDKKLLEQVFLKSEKWRFREEAIKKIEDQAILIDAVLNDDSYYVRQEAIKWITDQKTMAQLALKDKEWMNILEDAFNKITNSEVITDIAKNARSSFIRQLAILKIKDSDNLYEIWKEKNKDYYIQHALVTAFGNIENPNIREAIILITALDHPQWEMRWQAACGLCNFALNSPKLLLTQLAFSEL